MVERFDPPRDLDWKPLPMRPDIAGQYVRYSDLAAARAEIERLTKERDEVRAQVAAAYEAAANLPAVCYDNIVDRNAIRALTPADAKAALEAYGREKVREGMQHMLNRLQHEGQINPSLTYADAIEWAENILADMETLK